MTDSEQQDIESNAFRAWFEKNKNSSTPLAIPKEFLNLKYVSGLTSQTVVGGGGLYTNADVYYEKTGQRPNVYAGDPNWRPVQVGNGTAYVPVGSAGDMLNQAVAANPNLTPQQQMDASMTGNNVNAPGIVPVAPTPTAQTPAQATNYTVPQSTNANNGVYKTWNGTNWDVFDTKGNPIDQATFQKNGLNIDHINTQDVLKKFQPKAGETGTGTNIDAGSLSNSGNNLGSLTNTATNNLITGQNNATANATLTKMTSLNDAINAKQAELDALQTQYEASKTNIEKQLISAGEMTGRESKLASMGNDAINAKTRELTALQNQLTGYVNQVKLLAPQRVDSVTDPVTGDTTIMFQDSLGQTSTQVIKGNPKPAALESGIVGEYQYAKSQGYTGSFSQYQNEDANRKLKASGSSNITYSIQDIGGKTVRYGFDKAGNIVSTQELGPSGKNTGNVMTDTATIIKQYKDANFTRADIEKQYTDAGKPIPLEVKSALDTLYPAPPASTGNWFTNFFK